MSSNSHVELPFNQDHAFIIGINDYEHITPLKTAVNDAKGLAERLEAQHGYIVHGPYLDATREELEKLFKETMPALVKKEDRVLFYFAGHGIALDGEEGPNGYIVPKDAKQGDRDSLLPMNLLHDSINALPCQHGMLILDCCFSGAFKWSTGFRDVMFDLPKIIYEERFWRYVKDPAWQVITSSAYDQKAVDVISDQSIGMREEGEGIHSPFAKALFEAIDGAGDVIPADEGDGVITASELYAYLRDAVESKTNEQAIRQSPSMFNLERHDKGEFIFLNPRHRFNLPPTPDRNPFMGLASYDEADSNFFFGRDRVIEALVEKVKTNPLTVVSGASGTGKSSVINLLSRFYEINKGSISVDGHDLREYDLSALRRHIGVVLQDVFLFSDTIRANITLGNDDISEERIWQAADLVGARKFIQRLPGAKYPLISKIQTGQPIPDPVDQLNDAVSPATSRVHLKFKGTSNPVRDF